MDVHREAGVVSKNSPLKRGQMKACSACIEAHPKTDPLPE
jgi:hypothetical protein